MTLKNIVLSSVVGLASFLVVAIITLVAWVLWLMSWSQQPLDFSETPLLKVESGFGVQRVANILRARGHLSQDEAAVWYARLTHTTAIQQGQYRLETGMSWAQVLQRLHKGQVVEHSVTFIEGWRFSQILAHLQKQPFLQNTLEVDQLSKLESDLNYFPEQVRKNEDPSINLVEGLFFASTYRYTAGETDRALLLRANRRLKQELDQLWQVKSSDLPYSTPYEALIMASLVEKETGVAIERPQIAGVFVRRLRKNMRLQTDPTVIYGLGKMFDGDLTRQHLRVPTAYNTYTMKGLPPTPIASVGRAALAAALQPDLDDNTLYFVGKGDGTHHFSSSLQEHNRAVQHYQVRQRVENYQSSPSMVTQ